MNTQHTEETVDRPDAQGRKRTNVLGFVASPRKEGNTVWIVNKILEGKDDMQILYGALEHADALVLGSPVYMGQMSAQAKI